MSGHMRGSPLKSPQNPLSFWIECHKKRDGWIRYESKRRRPRPFTGAEKEKDKHRKILHSSIFSTGCNSTALPLSTLFELCTSASAPASLANVHNCKCSWVSTDFPLFSSQFSSQCFSNIYRCKCKCLKLPLTFFLQVSWPTPTDVQALWKGLANILRNIHILDISSIYSAVHPYQHKFSCMIYDFRFLVRNSGQTASLMSHTGSDHLFCINCHKEYKRIYNVTANDIMAWSPPAAMWETRGTLILGWNDSPQGFQGLTRRTHQRWGLLQQNNLI